MKGAIIIPARYASTRLPGKPLIKIADKTLLQHVCETAHEAARQIPNVEVLVATDDERILRHAKSLHVSAIMTPKECATGSDRVIAALRQMSATPDYVINLQGDSPLTPVQVILDLLRAVQHDAVVTPVMQLSWAELDRLRRAKQATPFSGTTAIVNVRNEALWFSKQIIPAIRNEENLRKSSTKSPIFQHLGIYGYSRQMLETFANLPVSVYEQLEGLEQLRFLENGYKIKVLPIAVENLNAWRGVDTLEDAQYVEQLILAGSTKI